MLLKPRILVSSDTPGWAAMALEVVQNAISESVSNQGTCFVMLTGGLTARDLYMRWANHWSPPWDGIRFLFGDERCVSPNHSDSNYALVMGTLLSKGVPGGCTIRRMAAEDFDRQSAAKEYGKLLPEAIDILLLGMGEDGHVASLFPYSSSLDEKERSVIPVTGPKPPYERLTITPKVIGAARSLFLLVTGKEKGRVLAEAMRNPEDYKKLPVCLAMNGTWLLDAEAASQITGLQNV